MYDLYSDDCISLEVGFVRQQDFIGNLLFDEKLRVQTLIVR